MGITAHQERSVFDVAKELSLSEFIGTYLGFPASRGSSGDRFRACPECGLSDNPNSNRLSIQDDRTWHCFSCGQGGDIINAAAAAWNVSCYEAACQLAGRRRDFKYQAPPMQSAKEKFAERLEKTSVMREVFSRIQQACASFKNESMPLEYLVQERAIPLGTVREAQSRGIVGFLPADPNAAAEVVIEAVGRELLQKSGIWKPESAVPGISYRPLVFFLPNLASAEFRVCGQVEAKWSKSIRYGVREYPYWWQGTDAQCMIVEGAIDMLSAVSLGFKGHVMGLTGCNTFDHAWFPAAAKRHGIKRFVIALDNDSDDPRNPGQAWARELKSILTEQGLPSMIKTPERGDINDILRSRKAA